MAPRNLLENALALVFALLVASMLGGSIVAGVVILCLFYIIRYIRSEKARRDSEQVAATNAYIAEVRERADRGEYDQR